MNLNHHKKQDESNKALLNDVQRQIQSAFLQIENSAVKMMTPHKMHKKYTSNREQFFEDVKNPLVAFYWKKVAKKAN